MNDDIDNALQKNENDLYNLQKIKILKLEKNLAIKE